MTLDKQVEALCRFKGARVKVRLSGIELEVEAVVWGVWAIHRSVFFPRTLYVLTHTPSGLHLAMDSALHTLAALAVQLDALGDWSSSKRRKLPLRSAKKVVEQWKKEQAHQIW